MTEAKRQPMPLRLTNYNVAAGEAVVFLSAIIGIPAWLLSLFAEDNLRAPQILGIILLLAFFLIALFALLPSITLAVTLSEKIIVRTLFQSRSYDWEELVKIDLQEEKSEELPGIKYRFAYFEFRKREYQSPKSYKIKVDSNGQRKLLALLRANHRDYLLQQPGTGALRLDSLLGASLIILLGTLFGAWAGWILDLKSGKNFIAEGCVVGACVGVAVAIWTRFHVRKTKS